MYHNPLHECILCAWSLYLLPLVGWVPKRGRVTFLLPVHVLRLHVHVKSAGMNKCFADKIDSVTPLWYHTVMVVMLLCNVASCRNAMGRIQLCAAVSCSTSLMLRLPSAGGTLQLASLLFAGRIACCMANQCSGDAHACLFHKFKVEASN